jgi:NADH dehydrogenase
LARSNSHRHAVSAPIGMGHGVDQIDEDGVIVAGQRIASRTAIWTARVAPSPAGKWLVVDADRAGRVKAQTDLTVPGHPEIFIIGDTAVLQQDGKPLPGSVNGRDPAGTLRRKADSPPDHRQSCPAPIPLLRQGNMTVVGKGFAVLQTGRVRISGFLAWMAWATVHLQFLAQSSLGSIRERRRTELRRPRTA